MGRRVIFLDEDERNASLAFAMVFLPSQWFSCLRNGFLAFAMVFLPYWGVLLVGLRPFRISNFSAATGFISSSASSLITLRLVSIIYASMHSMGFM
jgi:hypothetical protein